MSYVAMTQPNSDSYATSKTLVQRLRDPEDRESWDEFFDIYSPLIRKVAVQYGLSDTEVDEVLQETLIKLSQNIGQFEYDSRKGSFKKWLLNLVKWRIVDQKRGRLPVGNASGSGSADRLPDAYNSDDRTATIHQIPDPAAEVEQLWDKEWKNTLMEKALKRVKAKVKAKHYQIFDLYVMQQWSVSRIVSALGVNFGQVYLARHRVGSLVKKELKNLESGR
jgi:RNA polymerase sigma-70 factor (ECF subfamily)